MSHAMKMTQSLFAAVAGLMMIAPAIAGEGSGGHVGNGGGTWTCREPSGELRWIRLVDLDEGRRLHLKIPYGNEDQLRHIRMDQWLKMAEDRMREASPKFFDLYLAQKAHTLKVLEHVSESKFFRTQDINDRTLETAPDASTCRKGVIPDYPEQLANFDDEMDLLQINDMLWNDPKFMEIDRAALIMHEAIYRMYRDGADAKDSRYTRRLVAYLFSDTEAREITPMLRLSTLKKAGDWVPTPGRYQSVAGKTDGRDMADLQIYPYNASTNVLELRQYDRDTGYYGRFNRFLCEKLGDDLHREYRCKMVWVDRWLDRWRGRVSHHRLVIIGPNQMVWHNMRRNSVTWITDYVRVK